MRHRLPILGIALIVLASTLGAQTPAKTTVGRFVIDPSATVVAPTLGEGDVGPLAALLRLEPRGEFESTAAFSRRAAATLQGKTFAIAIRNGAGGDCAPKFTYDADSEQVSAYLTESNPIAVDEKGHFGDLVDVIELRCTRRSAGSFIGTNAFGVKTRVARSEGTVVSVASESPDEVLSSKKLVVPLSRADAPLVKPNLKILAVFEPGTSPRGLTVSRGEDVTSATRDHPIQESSRHTIFWERSIAFWVIDGRTGRVLAKHPVERREIARDARGANHDEGSHPVASAATDQPYFEFQVEKQVRAAPGSPSPQYPETLRSANIEGEVLAQFVVDTTGQYEPGSFKVIKSSHDLFTAAVKNALPIMKFIPAEIGGRKVRQLVQQPFTFGVAR